MSNVAPLIEAYFVAFTLKYGVDPTRKFGIDRHNAEVAITIQMRSDPLLMQTVWYQTLLRAATEVGSNEAYFLKNFAGRYLDWLYANKTTDGADAVS